MPEEKCFVHQATGEIFITGMKPPARKDVAGNWKFGVGAAPTTNEMAASNELMDSALCEKIIAEAKTILAERAHKKPSPF